MGVIWGIIQGTTIGVIKGDTRSLDYSSCAGVEGGCQSKVPACAVWRLDWGSRHGGGVLAKLNRCRNGKRLL